MPGRATLAIGAAAATYLAVTRLARARSAGVGGLAGLGSAPAKGAMGSPFAVSCDLDRECYEAAMDIYSGRERTPEDRRKYGTAEQEARRDCTKCVWYCIGNAEVRVARFRDRMHPQYFALLARSPKPGGGWQLSWFDEAGPWGDIRRPTQCELVRELSSGYKHHGRMHSVEGEIMSNWYLEEWK